jgi:hypothetical protein
VAGGAGRRCAAAAAAALTALWLPALLTPSPSAAASRSATPTWGRPYLIAHPVQNDLLPSLAAVSSQGDAAVGYTVASEDAPTDSTAMFAGRVAGKSFSRAGSVTGALQVLAIVYRDRTPQLLVGAAPAGLTCCSSAAVLQAGAHGFSQPHPIIDGLAGATIGRLVALDGNRILVAVATGRGVWTAQSDPSGSFGPTRALAGTGELPEALDATPLAGDRSAVAWTAPTDPYSTGPQTIFVATGTAAAGPVGGSAVVTVPGGHSIDELAVASHGSRPTVAWIESWLDSLGGFHSQAYAADVGPHPTRRRLSALAQLASGLSVGSDAGGDQVLGFRSCSASASCSVMAALRRAGRGFDKPVRLGAIDPTESPAVAVSPAGTVLTAWIDGGRVRAATAPASVRPRFGRATTVASTAYAADLAVAFDQPAAQAGGGSTKGKGKARTKTRSEASMPVDQAIAVWTQGTRSESLVAANFAVSPGRGRH